MIADRIDNLIGRLLIATPGTLANNRFQVQLRRDLAEIREDVRATEMACQDLGDQLEAALALASDGFGIPPLPEAQLEGRHQ